jgi:DNA-binding beta-propeller fold protein YncE
MTVSRALVSSVSLAVAVALAPAAARAESVIFSYEGTIYSDAKEAPLNAPEGVGCNDSGYAAVADTGNHRLLVYSIKEGRFGGGNEVKLPQLPSPWRVQVDAKGELLVLDLKTRKIVKVGADGSYGGTVEPKGIDDAARVVYGSFKLGPGGTVYALDVAGKRVLVLEPEGRVAAQLPLPSEAAVVTDVAVDSAGTVYALDAVGGAIFSADKGASSFKPLAKGLRERMSFPSYLIARKGRIFVVDQNGSGIVLLGVDGSYQGRQLSIGWSEGLVNYPAQLCMTENGLAFVADRFNNRVQVFTISN